MRVTVKYNHWYPKLIGMNAVMTQERYMFVTSRRNIFDLVKKDKMHTRPFQLHFRKFNTLLSYLYRAGVISRIEESAGRKAGIFKVESTVLYNYIFSKFIEEGIDLQSDRFQKMILKEMKDVYDFRNRWNG